MCRIMVKGQNIMFEYFSKLIVQIKEKKNIMFLSGEMISFSKLLLPLTKLMSDFLFLHLSICSKLGRVFNRQFFNFG